MSLCPKGCGRPRRRPGLMCNTCSAAYNKAQRAAKRVFDPTPTFHRKIAKRSRYIVTAAQNNTPVHAGFLGALQTAAAELRAAIIVVPYRYKNPTGMQPGADMRGRCRHEISSGVLCVKRKKHDGGHSGDELWWDPALTPYLLNERTALNPNLVLAADVKIQPTASDPLSGFEALTGAESCIIAHPKLAFKTVAVPRADDYPKILTTTGAVTQKNYSNTKAGALGEFHYTLGATLVEIDDKEFHVRQLLGDEDDGSFIDLSREYRGSRRTRAARALALVMGDTHEAITDPQVDEATHGAGGIVEELDPELLVWNDLTDYESCNPHDRGDPFLQVAKHSEGRTDIAAETRHSVEHVNARAKGRKGVIVSSNHHDFLRRWVVRQLAEGCHDPKNTKLFLECALYMANGAHMAPSGPEYPDPYPWLLERNGLAKNIRCLSHDESCKVGDVECGMHGHNGPNGARGTMKNLARIGTKSVTGHGHAPGIFEGHTRVGTSTPRRQSYHRGPGNNLQTHCVIYANRKRCLISIIGGRWRAKL